MKSIVRILMLALLPFSVSGQIEAELKTQNPSSVIDDGKATVEVTAGQAPFTYKWVNSQSTPLTSATCEGIREGVDFKVIVTDANGKSKELTGIIATASSSESINSIMTPIVNGLGSIMFWDPFAFIGIYDPVIYDDNNQPLLHANGDKRTQGIPFVVVWLVAGAIFFTIRMKFINFRGFKLAIDLVRGKYDDPNKKGEVSHFQALTTALSATVGLGNIAGVAFAIAAGGPGATFWMILAGLLGMASKFVECTLGVKFRIFNKQSGEVSGGPMYYLSIGLKEKGYGKLGKVLAVIFAVLCIGGSLGGGNMFQANQAFVQLKTAVPGMADQAVLFGVILAILVGVVIIGGIKSIAKVTDKIVPFMCGLYVLFALIIIFMNIGEVGSVFGQIIGGAFSADAMKGGFIGVLIIGFQRAAFSNEAGVGSASIAHSAVKTDEPVTEGLVALLEPFIDTVVVCTMTALVLIFTGYADGTSPESGAALTSAAFSTVFPWFKWVLLVAILMFAFSTMVSWSYYGLKAWGYLFGEGKAASIAYKALFLTFVVIGSAVGAGAVIDFSDLMILGMAFPNILGLIILAPYVQAELQGFMSKIKGEPVTKSA